MARRYSGLQVAKKAVSIRAFGTVSPPVCTTHPTACCLPDPYSGSGSIETGCIFDCPLCPEGMGSPQVFTLVNRGTCTTITTGAKTLYYDRTAEIPCRWVTYQEDDQWELYNDGLDNRWYLIGGGGALIYYLPSEDWNCDGGNEMLLFSSDCGTEVDRTVNISGEGCNPGTIETTCCPDDLVPATLYGSWSDVSDGCEGCLPDATFTYEPLSDSWITPAQNYCPSVPATEFMTLYCSVSGWHVSFTCVGSIPSFNLVSLQCAPFRAVFDMTLTPFGSPYGCCNGNSATARLTITQ